MIDYTMMGVPLSHCNLLGVGCTMIGVLNYAFDTTEITAPQPTTTRTAGEEKQPLMVLEKVQLDIDDAEDVAEMPERVQS